MDGNSIDLLKDQQKAQVLCKYKVGALFMEAGTGKTGAAWNIVKDTNFDYCLWLTPFRTKENLAKELVFWGAKGIDIQGIESLSSSDKLYLRIFNKLRQSKNSIIIVDESLKIKNYKAKRTRRIIELGRMAEYRLILNGTPLSRNLLDLWAQMEFLSPNILRMSEGKFKNTFCEYCRLYKNGKLKKEWIKKYHNIDYLYSLISPFVFDSKLDINKKRQYININYSIQDKELYEKIKEDYLNIEKLQKMGNNFFLELCQKLQNSYSRSEEKFQVVSRLIDEKTLIFCKYVETRIEIKSRFPSAKVMSYGMHSYGLNLQQFNKTIFFDKTWDYAQREQVERRTYRVGQESDCIYYDLTANCGLDRLIESNIKTKEQLLSRFKDKISEL